MLTGKGGPCGASSETIHRANFPMPDARCPLSPSLSLSGATPCNWGPGQQTQDRPAPSCHSFHCLELALFLSFTGKGCVYCLPDKRSCAKGGNHPMLHCRRVTPHLSGKMRLLILLYHVVLLSFCVYERNYILRTHVCPSTAAGTPFGWTIHAPV